LARLHDLTALEAQGVDINKHLAQEDLVETEHWVQRLAG
jgi:hypothetical protein